MPVKSPSKERPLIELFLSAYGNGDWKVPPEGWVEEKYDHAVEVVAEKPDGTKLAIEHTIIQLFATEKKDLSLFTKIFSRIENAPALVVPARNLVVFIPVRALTTGYDWEQVGENLLSWLNANHTKMPEGYSEYMVPVGSPSKKGPLEIQIGAQTSTHPGMDGCCLVAPRDMVPANLCDSVERALTKKLPKLVNTYAAKRILLLERDQIHPAPEQIFDEVMSQRAKFPSLAKIDEIWFVNTAFYGTHRLVDFVLIDDHGRAATLVFRNGALIQRLDNPSHREVLTG